jgi:hypothetical protein
MGYTYNINNPYFTTYSTSDFERDTGMPFKEEYKKMFPGAFLDI